MMTRNFFVLLGICACAGACDGTGGATQDANVTVGACAGASAEYRHAIDDRPVDTRTMPGLGIIRATGVVARDGCASIDGPLAAVNWWTTNDKTLLTTKYDAVVLPLVINHARIIFGGHAPAVIRAAEPPLPDHDSMAVVLYHSAESFSEMIGSEAHLEVVHFKETAVADAYSFSLQRCVVGCDDPDIPPLPPQIQGLALVVHYSMPDAEASEVDQAYGRIREALALDGRAALVFAGRGVGSSFHELQDGTRTRPFDSEGIDGTLIFELQKLSDAEQILAIAEVAAFLDETSADVVVTFGVAAPGATTKPLASIESAPDTAALGS